MRYVDACRFAGHRVRPWRFSHQHDVLVCWSSYRVKFPGVAELIEEHPPKRQQQAAAAKAPEITPFTS
ncbi:hypothetical protein FML40_24570 [Klebsiella variicola]|nr:hypothetical protein [Klebsiella variicola]